MARTLPSENLCCKPKLIVNNILFRVELVSVNSEAVSATRANHIPRPYVRGAPDRATGVIFEDKCKHAAIFRS
jgi:hypothetical protein